MQVTYDHFAQFGIRLPFRPISQLHELINSLRLNSSDNDIEILKSWLQSTWTVEGLYLASPTLLKAWLTAEESSDTNNQALKSALWRYLFRAYGRSTPYGLFAAMGMGRIGPQRQIEFGTQPWQPASRPDIRILRLITKALSDSHSVRAQLRYQLNNSLYETAGEYRYSKQSADLLADKIGLSALTISPDITLLVNALSQGNALHFEELIRLYEPEVQLDVIPYLHQLIDADFLVSTLRLPVTGVDSTSYLLSQLSELLDKPAVYHSLQRLQQRLQTSSLKLSDLNQIQQGLLETVHQLGQPLEGLDSAIQTDLFFRPINLELDETTLRQIAHQFAKVSPILCQKRLSPLQDFKRRFTKRYDTQEVDLLTVLDPEYGIGLSIDNPSLYPLLTDFPQPEPTGFAAVDPLQDEYREILFSRFLVQGNASVEITMADIEKYAGDSSDTLPTSWFLYGELFTDPEHNQVLPSAESTITQPASTLPWRFSVLSSPGSSAAYLLGRFCYNDESLLGLVRKMNEWEQSQYEADILAEFVHLPNKPAQAGNVIVRPILRAYELPYLTPASVPYEQTIYLADLTVTVTEKGQIILRSKRTGQRVRPRHSSAHNTHLGDELYQFLSFVQYDEYPDLGWTWRQLTNHPQLPRIVFQNLIIAPAQWTIRKALLVDGEILTVSTLRKRYSLPRYVLIVEGDNKLLLDLDFAPAAQLLLDEILKQDKVLLKEWIGESLQPWLVNSTDYYVSELIVPMKTIQGVKSLDKEPASAFPPTRLPTLPPVTRSFFPGQDWLYLKVYLSTLAADNILINVLRPLGRVMTKKGWSSCLFFVRYEDPENHLRIRFRTTQNQFHTLFKSCQKAMAPFLESGLVYRIQLDTYQRELERYGSARIEHCEAIFGADSCMVLDWLSLKDQQEADRMQFALLSADTLLSNFGFTLAEKLALCRVLQQLFLHEEGAGKELKRKLNDLYRKQQESFFLSDPETAALVRVRSTYIQSAVTFIKNTFSLSDDLSYQQVVGSIVHMSMNRIFQGEKRRYELIVYHFLARHYESQLARSKGMQNPVE